jgi:hypothetical protein
VVEVVPRSQSGRRQILLTIIVSYSSIYNSSLVANY